MNKEIRGFLKKNNYNIKKITIKGNALIIYTNNKTLVAKKRTKSLDHLFNYLKSRSFISFPNIIYKTDNYDFYEYINNIKMPREQRINDIIKLISSLHNKTTYYKDIDDDYYKNIYENTLNNINYLENYYNDIADIIEKTEYMSPSQYLFIRNISKVFISLNNAHNFIDEWYKIISEKKSIRVVNLHNNLKLEHYLVKDKPYFISWSKSKIDMPIFELINIYNLYYNEFDFYDLLKIYEHNYPLLLEEKKLFFSIISLPNKIIFNENEFKLCQKIKKFYNLLDTSQRLIIDYFPNKKEQPN